MSRKTASVITGLILFFLLVNPVFAANSSLSFSPPQEKIAVGEEKEVSIILNPRNDKVLGADIYLRFDPNLLQINEISKADSFDAIHAVNIDNQSGTAKFSLSNSFGNFLEKRSEVAIIILEAIKEAGNTRVRFDYTEGLTTDTNVAGEAGEDLLTGVESLRVAVAAAGGSEEGNILSAQDGPALATEEKNQTLEVKEKSVFERVVDKLKDILGVVDKNQKENQKVLGESSENSFKESLALVFLGLFGSLLLGLSTVYIYKELKNGSK